MKSVSVAILVVLIGFAANAWSKPETPLVTIEPSEADVRYGPKRRNRLHFWKAESEQPTPLVLFIHGGGWNGGSRVDKVLRPMLPQLLENGISVASIEYRLLKHAIAEGIDPPVQAPMHDAARALQFVRSKASNWNIDPQRIAASGGSAGACTSLWLAFHDDLADPDSNDPVARQSTRILCAGVRRAQTTLDPLQMRDWIPNIEYGSRALGITKPGPNKTYIKDFNAFLARRDEILDSINEYSPYALVTPDDSPVYLLYQMKPTSNPKQRDPVHSANFGKKLQQRMQEIGVDCELMYPGATNVSHKSIAEYLIATLKAKAN